MLSFGTENYPDLTLEDQELANGARIYQIAHPYGEALNSYLEVWGIYTITNLDVFKRGREGIGKTLLRASWAHARSLHARTIDSIIISREYLDAVTSVFGPEPINIAHSGGYTPEGMAFNKDDPTAARLVLRL